MNVDFRVSVSLPSHPKALKLMRRLGDRSFYCLVRFWSFVAQNRPDGDITGLDIDDIELACDWRGDAGSMHQALLDLCFIECIDGKMFVHDWEDYNGFACHAKERSEKAKLAAEARWHRRNGRKNANGMPQAMQDDATSNATSMQDDATSNAPSPSPSPSPNLKDKDTPLPPKGGNGIEYSKSFEQFWSAYPKKVGKDAAYRSWRKIAKRGGVSAAEIIASIVTQVRASHFKGSDGSNFIPNPSTWLNQGRWKDEMKTNLSQTVTPTRFEPTYVD